MNTRTTISLETQRVSQAASVPQLQTTLGEAIRFRAETQPDRPAIVSSGYAPFSYRELQQCIGDVRSALRAAGFTRSARIAVAMPNGPPAALAIVAVSCSSVSIPLNPRQTLREIEAGFAMLRPDAVLLAKGDDSDARTAAERRGIPIIEATPPKDGTIGFSIPEPGAGTVSHE
jgi:oxalate---CoA ligase